MRPHSWSQIVLIVSLGRCVCQLEQLQLQFDHEAEARSGLSSDLSEARKNNMRITSQSERLEQELKVPEGCGGTCGE